MKKKSVKEIRPSRLRNNNGLIGSAKTAVANRIAFTSEPRRSWDAIRFIQRTAGCRSAKKQMNLKDLDIIPPPEGLRKVSGPLLTGVPDDPKTRTTKKARSRSEPSEEYARFENLAKQLISVPKSEIDKREAQYQKTKKAAKRRRTT